MSEMVIRKIELSEAEAVFELEKECFHSPWPLEEIKYELSENPCSILFGVYEDELLIGYIDFMITFDSATINRICIKKEKRNKGYAMLLLQEMEKACKSQADPVEFITLEVRESNLSARNLYHKAGYSDITIKKMYYSDGENAVYMMRSLL